MTNGHMQTASVQTRLQRDPEQLWEEASRTSRWQMKGQRQTPRIPGWDLHQTLDATSMRRAPRSYEQWFRAVEGFYSKLAQETDGIPRPAPPHKSSRAAGPVWRWTKHKPARAKNIRWPEERANWWGETVAALNMLATL